MCCLDHHKPTFSKQLPCNVLMNPMGGRGKDKTLLLSVNHIQTGYYGIKKILNLKSWMRVTFLSFMGLSYCSSSSSSFILLFPTLPINHKYFNSTWKNICFSLLNGNMLNMCSVNSDAMGIPGGLGQGGIWVAPCNFVNVPRPWALWSTSWTVS